MNASTDEAVRSWCAAMAERLADRADEAEELRRLPDATIDDAVDAGLFAMVVPTSLGGQGLGLDTLANSTRILAHGCPASAWTLSFLVMHSWLLTRFSPVARAEFFPDDRPWALTPAPLAPTGTLRVVDGGYRLSGRWEWATGINHADWVMVHAILDASSDDGTVSRELATYFAVVPRSEVEVDDVWFTSGMRATGSNTVRIDDVFVPEHRTLPATTWMAAGAPIDGDGMAGLAVLPVLALVAAAPALGAAETAVDLFRERMTERVLAYTLGDHQRDQPAAQVRLATAMSELASARARWDAALAELMSAAADPSGPRELTIDERAAVRLSAAATVRSSRDVITTVCDGSGASIYRSSSPLQRLQRDVEVLKGHVIFDWDRTAELVGRITLGLPLRPTDLI